MGGVSLGDIQALVPILTSNTSSSLVCTAVTNSYYSSSYAAYYSFNTNNNYSWAPSNTSVPNVYIGVEFVEPHNISLINMLICSGAQEHTFNFDIEVYNGNAWSKIDSWSVTPPVGTQSGASFINCTDYVKQITAKGVYGIRLFSAEPISVSGQFFIGMPRLQFYGV